MFRMFLSGAVALVLIVPAMPVRGAGPEEEPITITASDISEREKEVMKATKRRLAETARALRKEAESEDGARNMVAYARAYEAFQEEQRRARKRVWWEKTEKVSIPEVPRPTSAAYEALAGEMAQSARQMASESRQAAAQAHALRLQQARLATEQAQLAEERRQSDILSAQTAVLADELYDDYDDYYGYYPYRFGQRVGPGFVREGPGVPGRFVQPESIGAPRVDRSSRPAGAVMRGEPGFGPGR